MKEKRIVNFIMSDGKIKNWEEYPKEEKERIAKFIVEEVEEAVRFAFGESCGEKQSENT